MSDHCDKEPIKEFILLRPFLIFPFKHKYNFCNPTMKDPQPKSLWKENKNMVLD